MVQKRIMLVDDSTVSRKLTEKILIHSGHSVVAQLASCDNLLAVYEESQPDLVVMDIYMPGIDGFAGCKLLLAQYPKAKVLFLSSMKDEIKEREANMMGAVGYLQKPIVADKLLAMIETVFSATDLYEPLQDAWQVFRRDLQDGLAAYGVALRSCGEVQEVGSSFVSSGICALMGINGLYNGAFLLDIPMSVAVELTRQALGEASNESEAVDMVAELANIVAGNALSKLNSYDVRYNFRLSPPSVYFGTSNKINLPQVNLQMINLECSLGKLDIAVGFKRGIKTWM